MIAMEIKAISQAFEVPIVANDSRLCRDDLPEVVWRRVKRQRET